MRWTAVAESDLDAWVEALAAIEAVDRTGEVLGRTDLEDELGLSYVDAGRDVRLGWQDGRIVAWGMVMCLPDSHQRRVQIPGAVIPERRRSGIGAELLRWQIDRGLAVAAARGDAGPGWLEVGATAGDRPREALFRDLGFSPLRYYFEMRRPLDETRDGDVAAPGTLVLRPWDESRDADIRAAHNEAFEDHFAAHRLDEETWRAFVTGPGFRPDCSFLVLDGDEVAGYAINATHPDDWPALGFTEGWTHQLGVRRPWRGRGIASALLQATAVAFTGAGLDYAALDVDADNPTGALRLYESRGYRRDKTRISWSRPVGNEMPG